MIRGISDIQESLVHGTDGGRHVPNLHMLAGTEGVYALTSKNEICGYFALCANVDSKNWQNQLHGRVGASRCICQALSSASEHVLHALESENFNADMDSLVQGYFEQRACCI